MNDSQPPVRALIGRAGMPEGIRTRVVLMEDVPQWVLRGWIYVGLDPDDEFQWLYWMETEGRRR